MTLRKTQPVKADLHQLIDRLLISYQPVATHQKSFFINQVPRDFLIDTDQEILCTLLGSLFYIIARRSRDTSIIIAASAYDDVTVLQIKDTNSLNNYAVLYEFQHLKMLSEKIGGFLDISNCRNKETIISFSFANFMANCESIPVRALKRA